MTLGVIALIAFSAVNVLLRKSKPSSWANIGRNLQLHTAGTSAVITNNYFMHVVIVPSLFLKCSV